ncbi:MAG: hypothetical protein KF832_23910 [Caldilineaceae bacterium]|nr:hypothetical protein [Caldilineaceae bacterium]
MNLVNWLLILLVSLLGLAALSSVVAQRRYRLWRVLSLTVAGLVSASIFATLFVRSPVITSAMQVSAETFSCGGTPAIVSPGKDIAITGNGEAGSTVTIAQGETTLATATIDDDGAYAATITLSTPGVQSVTCQLETNAPQSITLSFLVIGQAAAPAATNTTEPTATNTTAPTATHTPEPTATNTPEPTATNTTAPTATNTPEPTATPEPEPEAPVIDPSSIPDQILPGASIRLLGTAGSRARVRVTVNGNTIGGAIAGAEGNWRTTVGFAAAGTYTLTAQLIENDIAVAESEPVLITVVAPEATATNTPEPTATNTPAPTATNTPEPTATNTAAPTATNTAEPTATSTPLPAATNTLEPTATTELPTLVPTATLEPTIAAAQVITDTVTAPEGLPGTGGNGSQGLPWVILFLVLGAAIVLGRAHFAAKPMA